jgi:hypothetical protein
MPARLVGRPRPGGLQCDAAQPWLHGRPLGLSAMVCRATDGCGCGVDSVLWAWVPNACVIIVGGALPLAVAAAWCKWRMRAKMRACSRIVYLDNGGADENG